MCDVTIYSLHAEGRAGSWNSRLPCGPVGAVACDTPTLGGTMADGQADGYKDRQFDYWYGSLLLPLQLKHYLIHIHHNYHNCINIIT